MGDGRARSLRGGFEMGSGGVSNGVEYMISHRRMVLPIKYVAMLNINVLKMVQWPFTFPS